MWLIANLLALAVALAALPEPAPAHAVIRGEVPHFEDFPAPPAFRGTNARPDLTTPEARRYRTRLREGAKGKPNYAGIHNLVTWGCGNSCLTGAAVNAVTGRVVFLPGVASDIHARPDSRLLILGGLYDGEPELYCFYDFDGREFRLVKAIEGKDLGSLGGGVWPPMDCDGLAGFDWSPSGKLLIVRNSQGGSVELFETAMIEADRSGATVRIEGPCHSACTVLLSAKKVCVAKAAVIGVHGASRAGKVDIALTKKWARKYHPPRLRRWAESVGAYGSPQMTTISAPELWAMGFKRCPPLPADVRQELATQKARERAEFLTFRERLKRQVREGE